ncbi:MAG: deoxyribodipyrimidine photo-lyase, partial [Planctomycetota bacterium]
MGPSRVVEAERVRILGGGTTPAAGSYVLYWMQAAQREHHNPALEYALAHANALDKPLLIGFGLTDAYPEATHRHYHFMAAGLIDTAAALRERGLKLVVRRGAPDEVALALAADAALVVVDRGYLRIQQRWRARVAAAAACPVIQVECDVIVPVDTVSDHREYAARTIRPKLHARYRDFLAPLPRQPVAKRSLPLHVTGIDLSDADQVCAGLRLDRSVAPVARFTGGEIRARELFADFTTRLGAYATNRNQPQTDDVSHMSPYLHFGQISPVWMALELEGARRGDSGVAAYIEQLLVRRELACNYVRHEPGYDRYAALPEWARTTLEERRDDRRAHRYTRRQLEAAKTHDPYWNAAMREMRETGYMHNYMRMYWGKKILEWAGSPENGFKAALHLNNKYFVDGRDANSYVGNAWCYGLHDRAW